MSSIPLEAGAHASPVASEPGLFKRHGLLAPGIVVMRALNFRLKLLLVILCFAIPIVGLGVQYHRSLAAQVETAALEAHGIELLRASLPAIRASQDHRGLSNRLLNGDSNASSEVKAAAMRWSEAFNALAETDRAYGKELQVQGQIDKLRAKQTELSDKLTSLSPPQSFSEHTAIVRGLLGLISQVVANSKLALDPEPASSYAIQLAAIEGPPVLEAIAATRGAAAGILASQNINQAQRSAVTQNLALIRNAFQRQQDAFAQASKIAPSIGAKLDAAPVLKATEELIARIEHDLLAEAISAPAAPFWDAASKTLDAHYAFTGRTLELLSGMLAERSAQLVAQQRLAIAISVVFVLLAIYWLWAFYLVIAGGFRQLSDHIVRIAQGDFSARPWPWGRDEAAEALDVLRHSLASVHDMIVAIRTQADAVAHAAGEIAQGNQSLSARTETSATSVEETTRAMDQLRSQAAENVGAINAAGTQIAALTQHVAQVKEASDRLMQRMGALHGQSRQIAEIVGMIDGIAFQTNILALNASVEAARAGEAGRGFAVVAQEVRALASRCAEAARQISGIVQTSTAEIEAGTQLARSAGQTVGITAGEAQQVAEAMSAVRRNSHEQQTGIEQVHSALSHVADATQSNAALVEETAAATASLEQASRELNAMVGKFKLGQT